jgi:hypothetical protein
MAVPKNLTHSRAMQRPSLAKVATGNQSDDRGGKKCRTKGEERDRRERGKYRQKGIIRGRKKEK